jgi:anti-sigma B factor antagonist
MQPLREDRIFRRPAHGRPAPSSELAGHRRASVLVSTHAFAGTLPARSTRICGNREVVGVRLVPFETELEELDDGSLRLYVRGELDLATASGLEEALLDSARNDPARLVVDLAEVPFMDAAGLRVLIAAQRRQSEAGGDLVIGRPSRQVARLLEVAGERARFRILRDEAHPGHASRRRTFSRERR